MVQDEKKQKGKCIKKQPLQKATQKVEKDGNKLIEHQVKDEHKELKEEAIQEDLHANEKKHAAADNQVQLNVENGVHKSTIIFHKGGVKK